ncbi:MAG: ParA family protein [SAR324 cluster bacterium]|nr:ParA family protein [SAR324 cluster bacterium]
MRKIAISLSKGGVAKTTTAVNLAAGLAKKGARVLLLDTDTQGQVSFMFGLKPKVNLSDVITGDCGLDEATIQVRENLWIIAGGREIAGIKRLIDRTDLGGEYTLSEAFTPIEKKFDFVLVDTSPGWDSVTLNVLFYAEEILCPISLEVMTLHGLSSFIKSVEAVQKYNKNLKLRYIVPTFLDGRVKKSVEILKQLEEFYPDRLCNPIHYNVRLSEAPGYAQTIYEFAPQSQGAIDYEQLTERVYA